MKAVSRAGVALAQPNVGDGRCDWFRLLVKFGKGGVILRVGLGEQGQQHAGAVGKDVALGAIDFVGAVEATRSGNRGFTDDESTTPVVGRRRSPDRVRASPRTAVSTLAQMPASTSANVCAAGQLTAKSCGS
jgi:hypothetical protein